MKKSILASLLVPILLAGCSDNFSSDDSDSTTSSSTTSYSWQIVHLISVDEDALDETCVIYADSAIETNESTTDNPEYQVITAYVADEDYNILYHNQDGTIETTIESSAISDGLLTISLDDVPDNGYVTLEELSGDVRNDNLGSFMFSVQKPLLSDMVLNIPQEQTGTSCVKDSDYREDDSAPMFVNVTNNDDDDYFQSSYDENSIDGLDGSNYIPVDYIENATRDVLITGFDIYDSTSEEKTDLFAWTFVDSDNLYEAEYDDDGNFVEYTGDAVEETESLEDDDLIPVTWASLGSDTITLDDDSGVIIIHDDTTYFWQPIYDSSDTFTVVYETDEIDTWNSYFSGSVALTDSDWDFTSFNALTDDATSVDLADFSTLTSLDGTTASNSCTVVGDDGDIPSFCIDLSANFDPDEFTYQRLHIRLEEDDETTYQTIISEVNSEPVVLSSSEVSFDTTPTLTRIELNLMNTDDEDLDAIQYLMSQSIDLVSVAEYASTGGDDSAESDFFNDLNGYVATDTEIDELYQAVLETNTTTIQSTYEP